jgi:hypothetical protein
MPGSRTPTLRHKYDEGRLAGHFLLEERLAKIEYIG